MVGRRSFHIRKIPFQGRHVKFPEGRIVMFEKVDFMLILIQLWPALLNVEMVKLWGWATRLFKRSGVYWVSTTYQRFFVHWVIIDYALFVTLIGHPKHTTPIILGLLNNSHKEAWLVGNYEELLEAAMTSVEDANDLQTHRPGTLAKDVEVCWATVSFLWNRRWGTSGLWYTTNMRKNYVF